MLDDLKKENLDKIFDMAWLIFYQCPKDYTLERHQKNLEGLQKMIIKQAGKNEEEKILSLKLVDNIYKEIIEKGLKAKVEKRGLNTKKVKEEIRQRVFSEKSQDEMQIDFDSLYNPQSLETLENGEKNINFKENLIHNTANYQLGDKSVSIMPIGELRYFNAFRLKTYINKYAVTIREKEKQETFSKNLYTCINISQMDNDEEYRQAVIEKLLDLKNIERKGNENYIGELLHKEDSIEEYEIVYFPEEYTAVRTYNEQIKRKSNEKFKDER